MLWSPPRGRCGLQERADNSCVLNAAAREVEQCRQGLGWHSDAGCVSSALSGLESAWNCRVEGEGQRAAVRLMVGSVGATASERGMAESE